MAIVVGNCLEILPSFEGKVDLVIADPPYNIGEPYQHGDAMPLSEYIEFSGKWFDACLRTLKPGGGLWIIVPPQIAPIFGMMPLRNPELRLVNDVIWHYRFGPHMPNRFVPSHVNCMWFCRASERPQFNFEAVMEMSDRLTRYGDQRTLMKAKSPSGMRPPFDVWEVARVTGNSRERVPDCPNQLPERLVSRIIAACSKPGQVVLDPFAGSGTVVSVAQRMGRQAVGIELGSKTAAIAEGRIERDKEQKVELASETSPISNDGG